MNVAVVIRLMPSLGDELELNESGTDLDRNVVGTAINEFDDQALEEAILLKEATGATVTAIGLRAEGIEQALRVAFARGADRVVVVEAGEIDPYNSRAAAHVLAETIAELEPDLVLTGVQTPYDIFGQVAPYLAAVLGWSQASVVSGVTVVNGKAHVLQEYAGGRAAVLELALPAVVGVQSASSPPRYVSMGRLRQAMTSTPETTAASGTTASPQSTLVSLARPEVRQRATILDGGPEEVAAQIVGLLRQHGVVSR